MKKTTLCPVCNNHIDDAKRKYIRRNDSIYECNHCKSFFSNPQYELDELDGLYKERYWESEHTMGDYEKAEHMRNKVLYSKMLKNIKNRYLKVFKIDNDNQPKLLDFGCGPGYFAFESNHYGFNPTCVELSKPAVKFARSQYNLNVIQGSIDELVSLPDNYFDIITCWSVLEHLNSPKDFLKEFHRLLKPKGFLCISVPNLSCYEHRLKKEKWYNIENPTHVVFYNIKSLKNILKEAGFNNYYRPIFFGGGNDMSLIKKSIQYLIRILNIGHSLRIDSQKI